VICAIIIFNEKFFEIALDEKGVPRVEVSGLQKCKEEHHEQDQPLQHILEHEVEHSNHIPKVVTERHVLQNFDGKKNGLQKGKQPDEPV
jgi:hypothetical protein